MKKHMVRVCRNSSPRTGKEIDIKLVLFSKLKKHLLAGWREYKDDPPAKLETEYRRIDDLNSDEVKDIMNSKETAKAMAEKYNLSLYSVTKLRSKK